MVGVPSSQGSSEWTLTSYMSQQVWTLQKIGTDLGKTRQGASASSYRRGSKL